MVSVRPNASIKSGPGYDHLLAVEIEGLRHGWNEQIIASYPTTSDSGSLRGPFAYPFVLPDQSGVIFNAAWPGPKHGVYLAEWPADFEVSYTHGGLCSSSIRRKYRGNAKNTANCCSTGSRHFGKSEPPPRCANFLLGIRTEDAYT